MNWAIEVRDRRGETLAFLPSVTAEEIEALVSKVLNEETGGIVIYRSIVAASNKKGGDGNDDQQDLGLVKAVVAQSNGNLTYCRYCRTTGGHTGDCAVIS